MQDKTNHKTIVLTGATGALGMELLPRLLRRYPEMDLVAVVRAVSPQEAETRLARALDNPELLAAEGHRIRVLPGDVSKPLLGLDETTAQQLAASTEKLFHSGRDQFLPPMPGCQSRALRIALCVHLLCGRGPPGPIARG